MKYKFTVVFLLVCLSLSAQNKKWTLQECVAHALEHNITIQQSENTLLINEQDITAAKGQFLPSLNANVRQNLSLGNVELFAGTFVDRTFHSTGAGFNVSQTVFNGFRNTNLYKQSKLNLETNKLELDRIKDDISLNVANAYLNVLFNKENFAKKQIF